MTAKELFDQILIGNLPETDIYLTIQNLTDDIKMDNIIRLQKDFNNYLRPYVREALSKLEGDSCAIKLFDSTRSEDNGNLMFLNKYWSQSDFTPLQMYSMLNFSAILSGLQMDKFILKGLYERELSKSELFIEEAYTGKWNDLELFNRVQEFTSNFHEDKLNLFCKEFDISLSYKIDLWGFHFTKDEIRNECLKVEKSGGLVPIRILSWDRRLYVSDFFNDEITDQQKKEYYQYLVKFIRETKRDLFNFVDVWQLMSAHGHDFHSLFRLRDLLVDLKLKYCGSISSNNETENEQAMIAPLRWQKSTESLKQLIEELIQENWIEEIESEQIINEHFKRFNSVPESIVWKKSDRLLLYFIFQLRNQNLIDDSLSMWQIIDKHFVKANGQLYKIDQLMSDWSNIQGYSYEPRGFKPLANILDACNS